MAAIALTDAYLTLNATNLSTYVQSIELNVDVEDLDTTTMGNTAKKHQGGLRSGSLTINFVQDFAVGALDATLWPLLGTVVNFEVRPTSGAVSTSNPKYTGQVLVSQWNPVSNGVGELATVSVTFPTSGPVTRATA